MARTKIFSIRIIPNLIFYSLGLIIILFFNLTASAEIYSFSIGHVPPLEDGHTYLLVTDLNGQGPSIEVAFFDEYGRNISSIRKLLPPNGKLQFEVDNYLRNSPGSIVLKSSSPNISGEYWQFQGNGSVFMLPLQTPVEEGRYFVNCFRFLDSDSCLLVLSDPFGSGPAVQMEFYSKSGELLRVVPKMLRPHGILILKVDDYIPWEMLGKVSIRNFRGSVIPYYRQSWDTEGLVFAFPARMPSRELFIDMFSANTDTESRLIITDTNAEGPAVRISFLGNDGSYRLEKLLPINGTALIDPADYIRNAKNGIIHISGTSRIIADYLEKGPEGILGIPAVGGNKDFLFISHFTPLKNSQDFLSLLNTGQESVALELFFFNDEGKKLGVRQLQLDPYERKDELMKSYFEGSNLGTVVIRGANGNIVASSYIRDTKTGQLLGKGHAQFIR
ncbi:hypothetical protein GF312_03855 [Candidatus Poribacteria bacterium]|nr:hypothetical protein [Candidatus Poribacteria bacterium]